MLAGIRRCIVGRIQSRCFRGRGILRRIIHWACRMVILCCYDFSIAGLILVWSCGWHYHVLPGAGDACLRLNPVSSDAGNEIHNCTVISSILSCSLFHLHNSVKLNNVCDTSSEDRSHHRRCFWCGLRHRSAVSSAGYASRPRGHRRSQPLQGTRCIGCDRPIASDGQIHL